MSLTSWVPAAVPVAFPQFAAVDAVARRKHDQMTKGGQLLRGRAAVEVDVLDQVMDRRQLLLELQRRSGLFRAGGTPKDVSEKSTRRLMGWLWNKHLKWSLWCVRECPMS